MPFDIVNGPEHVPIRAVPQWRLREQLARNAEYLLSLPIGPLLQLELAMALTGQRHVWNHEQCGPVPLVGPDGQNILLDEASHLKLIESMVTRLLPRTKSMDTEQLRPKGDASDSLKNLPISEIRAKLAELEERQNNAKPDPTHADDAGERNPSPGAGATGNAPVRPVDQ